MFDFLARPVKRGGLDHRSRLYIKQLLSFWAQMSLKALASALRLSAQRIGFMHSSME